MMQVNLLRSLPKTKRDVSGRARDKTSEAVMTARQYGQEYFDGPRQYGYGGYTYDGRWRPVAADIRDHYRLGPGARVLDIGAAKGFLVKDLCTLGFDAYGLDFSRYALMHCEPDVVGRLNWGTATVLPYPDKSFDFVLSVNTLHNLSRQNVLVALREIMRVARGPAFVQVDSYHTEQQKRAFEDWVLTARHHDYPAGWLALFEEAGYTGDYDWTIVE